jgi:hypothetical protein
MRSSFRRYEVLVPIRFNDGVEVPDELVGDTLLELRKRFGSVSLETQIIRGQWSHEGQTYLDENMRMFLDVPDTEGARRFFVQFKRKLKKRFKQIDVWITTYPIEVVR